MSLGQWRLAEKKISRITSSEVKFWVKLGGAMGKGDRKLGNQCQQYYEKKINQVL